MLPAFFFILPPPPLPPSTCAAQAAPTRLDAQNPSSVALSPMHAECQPDESHQCQYCWWGRYDIGAPYYGAYFAAMALAGADQIAPLDDQTTAYAAYAIYESGSPVKVLLYNAEYYASGTRPEETFTLTGLSGSSVSAKRLTAAYATSRVDYGENPTVAGQTFANGTCTIQGTAVEETTTVSAGEATFTVGASEALLVYL